jgi:hypothetical protein
LPEPENAAVEGLAAALFDGCKMQMDEEWRGGKLAISD